MSCTRNCNQPLLSNHLLLSRMRAIGPLAEPLRSSTQRLFARQGVSVYPLTSTNGGYAPLMSRKVEASLFLSLCLLVSPLACFAQEPAPEQQPTLTLEDAVRFAQENNRTIKNAVLAASIAADRTAEARTYRFPSLNVYALGSQLMTPLDFRFDQGTFGTFPGIGPIPATNTSIHTPLRPTFFGVTQLTQ